MGPLTYYLNHNRLLRLIILLVFIAAGTLYLTAEKPACELAKDWKRDFLEINDTNGYKNLDQADFVLLFNARKADYDGAIGKLMGNHQFMAIFLVLSLMVLIYRPKDIRAPIVGIDVPEALIYIFILFGIIYLWSSFTLLLISTIDSRLVLEQLADVIERDMGGVHYYYSQSRTLLDQGFVDGWSTYYFNIFKDSPSYSYVTHRESAGFMLFIVYAPLYGLTLAASLAVSLRALNEKRTVIALMALLFNLFSLFVVPVQILLRMGYAYEYFAAVWVFAGIALILWLLFGEIQATRVKEARESSP